MNASDCAKFVQINDDALSFIGYMVDKYGDILGLDTGKPIKELLPEYHHDYFYFCLTKATRSLVAANILAKMMFREDAMILARTAYETYLLLANVIKDERFVNNSIIISLMLITGEAKYLKLGNGKLDFKKVMVKGIDKPVPYDMSISTLSKNTFSKYDKHIHKALYKYMSEFQHGDFISAGDYRTENDKKYDVEPHTQNLDIHFTIMYIICLLLESMCLEYSKYSNYLFNQIGGSETSELSALFNSLKENLYMLLDEIDFSGRSPNLKDMILKRISEKNA